MKNYRRNIFRNPRTTQERRESQDKNSNLFRAKRNSKNLPTCYDDILVQKKWKCWKDKRKTQYKNKQGFSWHKFECESNRSDYNKISKIENLCRSLDYHYIYEIINGKLWIFWFGKDVS